MNEQDLIDKLRRVEALFSGGATAGERSAAAHAKARLEARLREFEQADPPVEFQFSLDNRWSRRLFLALIRRYGLHPYRHPRQRKTTVMVKLPKRFCDEVLWPEFCELDGILKPYLDEVADRVIGEVVEADCSEAAVVKQPRQLIG